MQNKIQFDVLYCAQDVANLGIVDCSFDPSNIEGVLFLKKNSVITPTQALTIQTHINGLIKNDSTTARAHLMKRFEGCEDKKTEGLYTESPYGVRRKVRNGKYAWRWEYKDGGLAMHSKLSTFDGKQNLFDALLIDPVNNCFWGCKSGSDLKGFRLDLIDVPNFDANNGTDTSKYYLELVLADEKEINLRSRILKLPEELPVMDTFNDLIDTEMAADVAMTAGGLVYLGFRAGNGAVNLYTDYNGALDTVALYTVTNLGTGAAITVTTATATPATETIALQLNAADPDYPATAGDLIKIAFGPVSAIDSNGMPGYSNVEIIVPRG